MSRRKKRRSKRRQTQPQAQQTAQQSQPVKTRRAASRVGPASNGSSHFSFRTANPALNDRTFQLAGAQPSPLRMTLEGTAFKALILIVITMLSGAWAFKISMDALIELDPLILERTGEVARLSAIPDLVSGLILGGVLVGFVVAVITIFVPTISAFTSPVYAIAEGLALGACSTTLEYAYPGIVPVAIGITFCILFTLLLVYLTGMIKPSENFALGVTAATGGICFYYLGALGSRVFFDFEFPLLHETGWQGICFSVFVVVIASLNLVLDFDFIEQGVEQGSPKYFEWYGAFGLLVTLVWLYLEVLHMLAKIMASSKENN